MAFRIPMTDYEPRLPDPGVTEDEFDKGQDLKEGINGKDKMHTRFENTERTQVLAPRGDKRGRPMPRDARFLQANNRGEWGPDTYQKRWEGGMDGPMETRWMHGLGLPSREDLQSNANPQFGGAGEADFGGRAMDQAVGKKDQ
ncbi:MAG TPA: hypothetical protein VNH18_31045 [Bryobacteraceae bacterium]|nr:hypothetical protein [Bryobacteraceae bacterium]